MIRTNMTKILNKKSKKKKVSMRKNEKQIVEIVKTPNIEETERFILATVKGQNEQVRQIVNAEFKSIHYKIKSNVLIIGKSGTGKSEILRQLAKKVNRPCVTVDANDYTEEAYQGANVSDIILELLREANYDLKKAENGIIIIDEIDKKAKTLETTQRDVSGKGVQDALLKLIESKRIPLTLLKRDGQQELVWLNTDRIMFYFAGAFSGIDEIVKKRLKNESSIGFVQAKINNEDRKIKKRDLVEYGMQEEFVGRLDVIVQLNELSEDVLEDILLNSKNSRLKMYIECLKRDGISTKVSKKNILAFAKKAKMENSETGARELSNVLNYVFDKIMYQVMSNPKGTYKELILQEGIEEDNTKYILK